MLLFIIIVLVIVFFIWLFCTMFPKSRVFIIVSGIIVILIISKQSLGKVWNNFVRDYKSEAQELGSENNDLESQVETLQSEVERLTSENEELRVQMDTLSSITEADAVNILSLVYERDGNIYKPADDFTFYSDIYCSNAVSGEIRFFSTEWLYEEIDNGNKVYILLSDEGFVYSIKKPQLKKIEG